MSKCKKTAKNNQWTSNKTCSNSKENHKKTATDNQWTSTNAN